MKHSEFKKIFEKRIKRCDTLLIQKAEEYATEDRLHNFKVAGVLQGIDSRSALGGMFAKHIVSIFDMIETKELANISLWDEKITDSLNYLFLLEAIVIEEYKDKESLL